MAARVVDTKKVMVNVPNRYFSNATCGRFGHEL